jgi:hypothetical protein
MNAFALALSHRGYLLLMLAMLSACFLFRRFLRDRATPVTLLVCSIALFYAFAIQHNEWWYHAYPYQALFLLAMAYLLTDLLYPLIERLSTDSRFFRRTVLAASGAMAVLLCIVAMNLRVVFAEGTHLQSDPLDEFLAQYRPSTTVYVFSTSEASLSFSYNHGLNWGGRFAHLWMLPAIIQNELGPIGPTAPFKRLSPETVAKLAGLQRKQSAEDLNYWRPAVVLVEQCVPNHFCQGLGGKKFDMLSWFLQSPEFAAAWSHYQREPGFDNYEVYKLAP